MRVLKGCTVNNGTTGALRGRRLSSVSESRVESSGVLVGVSRRGANELGELLVGTLRRRGAKVPYQADLTMLLAYKGVTLRYWGYLTYDRSGN